MDDNIRIHEIISKLEAPSVGWKTMSNYWGWCAIGYAPTYFQYLTLPDVVDQERFFSDNNDDVNHVWGFDKTVTPIGRMESTISAWAACFTENLRTFQNPPYDKADTPLMMAEQFKSRDRKSNISDRHPLASLSPQIVAAMQIQDTLRNQKRHDDTAESALRIASIMSGRSWLSEAQLQGMFTSTDPITPEMLATESIRPNDIFEDLQDDFDPSDLDDLLESRNEDKPFEKFAQLYQSYFSAAVLTGWAATFNPELQSYAYFLAVSNNQLQEIHDSMGLKLPDRLEIFERRAKAKGWKPPGSS